MRPATPAELARWDDLVSANPDGGQVLQTRAWGEFKSRHGWRPSYRLHETSVGCVAILFLTRRIPGIGPLWYSPKGPGVTDPAALLELLSHRGDLGGAFAVKVEPEIEAGNDLSAWPGAGLVKAPRDVQISRATIVMDLRPEEKVILASFKPKCRYNIRLASRRGVRVRPMPMGDAEVDIMYRLMLATQGRAGFTLRHPKYFSDYWRRQQELGQGQLFFAFHGDEILAGAFVTFLGAKAWYKDGGSVKRHSELMAPHLLQWEVMRWLRARGTELYDMVAVPRPAEMAPEHPLHGLYRFKSGFSERVTEFVGTWDLPLDQRRYRLWNRVGERAAHQWTLRAHRDLFY
ncbi:MAG: lipid II:glycine glycyltransferase FemX [Candidatus Dormibacteria bacterium]